MRTTVADMKLQEILERHGIHTIRKLCQETGLSRQRGWMLWWGKAGVGKQTAKLLHEKLGIPFEELLEVDPVPYDNPKKRQAAQDRRHGHGKGRGGSGAREDA
jgi:hypothetical protein